jgi:hypothetical protein
MRLRLDNPICDRQTPQSIAQDTPVERVASFTGAHHVVKRDTDGNWHVYRKGSRTIDDRLSEGIADPRPSNLRESLARINQLRAEFCARRGERQ